MWASIEIIFIFFEINSIPLKYVYYSNIFVSHFGHSIK